VEAAWTAKTEHLVPFVSAQNQWSLIERGVEKELVPAAQKYGLGILPYFPLAAGFLTGKYRQGEPPPEGARLAGQGGNRWLTDKNFEMLTKLSTFADEHNRSMVELAISWLASQPSVSSVIAGATRPEQVEENASAADWKLTAEEMAEIDEIMGVQPQGRNR
jgi:aryl-alcohol dehydrogenase-like predicted oxidoreductase